MRDDYSKEETKEKERETGEEKKSNKRKDESVSVPLSLSLCSIIADDSDPWTGFPLTSAVSQKKNGGRRSEKRK